MADGMADGSLAVHAAFLEASGRKREAAYLYLASYEEAAGDCPATGIPDGHPAIEGLRRAWKLAQELSDVSLMAHVLGRLERHLPLDELERFSAALDAAEGIQEDDDAPEFDFPQIAGAMLAEMIAGASSSSAEGEAEEEKDGESSSTSALFSLDGYTFDSIVGYDEEVERLRNLGIVENPDPEYLEFVEQMRRQHGLYDEAAGKTVAFCSQAREDADRLMLACAHELGKPIIVMRVMESAPGMQALCIITSPGASAEGFHSKGTLVLEGIDTWGTPGADVGTPYPEAMLAGSAQGALKAVALIRMAISNPKVTVLCSASQMPDAYSFIGRILGPLEPFDVPAPSEPERDAIWNHLMDKHVSMSALDRYELVELSRGMPRCDIFDAAREAVAQAFRQSLEQREYVPVKRGNLLDKIAAYQPLDSEEYRKIEQGALDDLRDEIERLEQGDAR